MRENQLLFVVTFKDYWVVNKISLFCWSTDMLALNKIDSFFYTKKLNCFCFKMCDTLKFY